MRLDQYRTPDFSRGVSRGVELAWILCSGLLVAGFLPGSGWRRSLLRLFGARIGRGVIIKPRVQIKFPWRLRIGDHCWIGEGVWIDNLAQVDLGDHVCLSQGAYLCTGSHDWSSATFDLVLGPIAVGHHAWIGAFARLAPGTQIAPGAVVCMSSLAAGTLDPWTIYRGNPAVAIKPRPRTS